MQALGCGLGPCADELHHAGQMQAAMLTRTNTFVASWQWCAGLGRPQMPALLTGCQREPRPRLWPRPGVPVSLRFQGPLDRRSGAAEAMLESVWLAQHGALCRGMNWDRHSLEDLTLIAGCVGGRALAAICRLLAEDYSGWSGACAP